MLHDFGNSLAKSKKYEDAFWWEEVYAKAFPGYLAAVSVRDDGWAQRGGIDRVVTLKSGKPIWVDEKVREEDWPDILLERWSDKFRQAPGWVQKDLACDFIAYVFLPSQRCYFLPFQTLRRAWSLEGRRWCELAAKKLGGFKFIDANNKGYTTESIAVPINVLMASIQQAMVATWEAREQQPPAQAEFPY